jgi:hypothetical protein
VEVEADKQGVPQRITVLESPDEHIANAVRATVLQWRFRPVTIRGVAVTVVGKLTFYFDLSSGTPRVRQPSFRREESRSTPP